MRYDPHWQASATNLVGILGTLQHKNLGVALQGTFFLRPNCARPLANTPWALGLRGVGLKLKIDSCAGLPSNPPLNVYFLVG